MNKVTPRRIGHTAIIEEFGKLVFRESYETESGTLTNWLLFGSTSIPVVILPLDDQGRVIAIEHFRYGAHESVIELPGGGVKSGQSAEAAVMEELAEETGYRVAGSIRRLGLANGSYDGVWFDPASVRVRFIPFLATSCVRGEARPEAEEDICVKLYSVGRWYEMLANGEIVDSKSFAVSVIALRQLDRDLQKEAIRGLSFSDT